MMLDDLMERTAAAVASGETLRISPLARQTRGRGMVGWAEATAAV